MDEWDFRVSGARSFEPNDRIIYVRLQKMGFADAAIPDRDFGIAGAQPDRSLLCSNALFHQADEDLAPANRSKGRQPVSIVREYGLLFRIRLVQTTLHAKGLSSGEMSQRIAWSCRHGPQAQRFCMFDILGG